MLVGRLDPHDALRDIEWNTLFLLRRAVHLISAVVHVGIIGGIADALADVAGGDLTVATLGILRFSALASAIVDNIPYTATAIPIVQQLRIPVSRRIRCGGRSPSGPALAAT